MNSNMRLGITQESPAESLYRYEVKIPDSPALDSQWAITIKDARLMAINMQARYKNAAILVVDTQAVKGHPLSWLLDNNELTLYEALL